MNTNDERELKRSLMKIETLLTDIYDFMEVPLKHCPVCDTDIRLFTPFGEHLRPNAKCPVCGSLERTRAWWLYYHRVGLLGDHPFFKLLHFAPEKPLFDQFIKDQNMDYFPVDYDPDFPGIRQAVDITNIPCDDDSFDRIICNHVLEHIVDEQRALQEIKRVLKPNGICYLSVPIDYKMESTLEKEEYDTPELRSRYYGQSDHVRQYGRDFAERVQTSGLVVREINMLDGIDEMGIKKFGINNSDSLWECTK
ncbi:MAG: class I SAM-dependent methyltransferase [bacterium]|nr:class I SAM-dependent methyltransferase [bacterium]